MLCRYVLDSRKTILNAATENIQNKLLIAGQYLIIRLIKYRRK